MPPDESLRSETGQPRTARYKSSPVLTRKERDVGGGPDQSKKKGKFARVKSRFKLFYIEQVQRQKRIAENDHIKREELIRAMIQSGEADKVSLTASSSGALFSPIKRMTFEEKKRQKMIDPSFQTLKDKYSEKFDITPQMVKSTSTLSLDEIPTDKNHFAAFLENYFKTRKLYNPRLPKTVDYLKYKPQSLLQPSDIHKSLLLDLSSNLVLKSIAMRTRAREKGDTFDDDPSIKSLSTSSSTGLMSMYRLPPVKSPGAKGKESRDESNVTEEDILEYMSLVGRIDDYDVPQNIWEHVVALENELDSRGNRRASKLPQLVSEDGEWGGVDESC